MVKIPLDDTRLQSQPAARLLYYLWRPIVNCEEKERLAREYEAAMFNFSIGVTELRGKAGTSSKGEYERLNRAANEARLKSEQARLALEEHIAAHRC
jgi:hypothetical protein